MTNETQSTEGAVVPIAALQELQTQLAEATRLKDEAEAKAKESDAKAQESEQRAKAESDKSAASDEQVAALKLLNDALEKKKIEAEERAERASPDANVSHASSKERYRIMIFESADKSMPKTVDVSPNGRVYQIKRGFQIDVPLEVVDVLTNAVVGNAVPQVDERTGIEAGVEYVQAMRFPFQNYGKSKDAAGNLMPGFEPLP